MKRVIIVIFAVIICLAVFAAFIINRYSRTSNLKDIYFTVEKGSSLGKISSQLKESGVIESKTYFQFYTKLNGYERKIKAGNYILSPKMKLKDLLTKFQNPQSDYIVVTIPEGHTLYQIAGKLEENNLVNKEAFLDMKLKDVDSNNLVVPGKNLFYEMEGFLFPDTYYIPTNATENKIAEMMFKQFENVFSQEYRDRAKELGLSINNVITIASLIEKEAANDKERKTIAGVIYNRLKKGMPLQIDATVIYAITKGERHLNKVYYNDLKVKSEFNTYLYKGLPPGPIASPGRASIEAALYPEKNDYLYYVLGDNGHVFSRTYKEHIMNTKKY